MRLAKKASLVCLLCAAAAIVLPAQTFTLLHNFDGTDGDGEGNNLTQGRDGNLYATAVFGGPDGCGTAFRLTPSGAFRILYDFTSTNCTPVSDLALGPNGLFYANIQNGGTSGNGGVFNLSAAGAFTLVASLDGSNGSYPGDLILGTDGNYYGAARQGGTRSEGTLFKVTPRGTITDLHNFGSLPDDGSYPVAIVEGPEGALYGATYYGGTAGDGVVFQITHSGGYKILVNFDSTDGANPTNLLLGSDGNLYGYTTYGGANGYGTIFKMTPAGVLTVLHSFTGTDGQIPSANPIEGTDGKLYGTAILGGTYGDGTIFSITTSGTFEVLFNFNGTDGTNPYGGLTQHTNGVLYGSAAFGGAYGDGTLFSLDVGLGPFVRFLLSSGKVGTKVQILGQNLTGTTAVTFNGTSASFKVVSDTFLIATVPAGATSGTVEVTKPHATVSSNVPFTVIP
ncbi:MAG TPA: choice-of-anchor tandem repeat GloVer-containing protein [Terriglobia bacterium]|nr:choice-of-anchor tandem repeat GloVer-containing protein [Terriglobia bacterium]